MCRHQWEKNPSPVKSWKGDRLVANSTANSSEELSHIYHPELQHFHTLMENAAKVHEIL